MGRGYFLKTFSFRKKMLAIGFISLVSLFFFIINDRGRSSLNDYSYKDIRNQADESFIGTTRDNVLKMRNTQMPISPSTEDIQHERLSHLRQTCERLGAKNYSEMVDKLDLHTLRKMDHIYVLDEYKTLFCYVPKAGCTSWKRVLLMLHGTIHSTMDVNHTYVHQLAMRYLPTLHRFSLQDAKYRLAHYNKLAFVREPFSRILSAFRDKFEVNSHKNGAIKKMFASILVDGPRKSRSPDQGPKRVATIGDQDDNITVTFGNFVDYVSNSWNSLTLAAEEHWREMFRLCLPCDVPYDFIGQFETLDEDSRVSLHQITKDDNVKFPESTNPTNSSDSAIFNHYYSQLSPLQLELLYKRISTDIELFNYRVPAFIKNRMNSSYFINEQNLHGQEKHHEH